MKRLLGIIAVSAVTLALATPAAAGHFGYRGGHARLAVGGCATHPVLMRRPAFYRPRAFFSFGFGYPAYYYPAPAYYAPPVVYRPAPYPVWIPGHWDWDGGVRFFAEGHWSR